MCAARRTLMPKLFLLYDRYEHHQVVSTLLYERGVNTVLDGGGNLGVLTKFLNASILSVTKCYLVISAPYGSEGRHAYDKET